MVYQAGALAQPFSYGSSGSGGGDMSSSAPHICVLHTCVMCGKPCLGPIREHVDPPVNIANYDVHDMLDAPDVMTRIGGYLGESSHARGEEVPSSCADDVVVRLVTS